MGSGNTSLYSYKEKFDELFPYYLSLGMTEEQYWDKDCWLVVPYRKADEIRKTQRNYEMWLQGAYFYEAMGRVSPVFHAFAKKGTKPAPYLAEPFAISEKQAEYQQEVKEKKTYDKGKAFMEGFVAKYNKKFEGK